MELGSHLLEQFPEQVMNSQRAFESLTIKGLAQELSINHWQASCSESGTQKGRRRELNEPQPVCGPRHQKCPNSESRGREGILKL